MDDHEDADEAADPMHDSDGTEIGEDEEGWQRPRLPKKRKPTRDDRVSRFRYALQLRPLVKTRIRQIPRHAIASIIGQTAPSAELAEMAAVTFDDVANSAHISVYDEVHANRLTKIDHLFLRQNGKTETIEVVVNLIPSNKNTVRGVIQIDPADSNDTILSWLRCEQAEILKVQKIGKSDRAILTFNSPTLPRTVKYYMELLRVADYRPKRLVCFNCHSLGHMAKFCPSPSVCSECGRPHDEDTECESTTYCVACKDTGHLAVSKVCPSRAPKKEEEKKKSSFSSKQSLPEKEPTKEPRSTPQGVTWASVVAGTSPKLPDNHPLVVENAELRRSLSELRTEMATMHKELANLRKAVARRQSVSPASARPTSKRSSRSRTSRKLAAEHPSAEGSSTSTYVTEQVLAQRDARLKFQNNKDWQKASSEIVALQEQVTSLKGELSQIVEHLRNLSGAFQSQTPPVIEPKRKKQ